MKKITILFLALLLFISFTNANIFLEDDFNTGTINPAIWSTHTPVSGFVTEHDGYANITLLTVANQVWLYETANHSAPTGLDVLMYYGSYSQYSTYTSGCNKAYGFISGYTALTETSNGIWTYGCNGIKNTTLATTGVFSTANGHANVYEFFLKFNATIMCAKMPTGGGESCRPYDTSLPIFFGAGASWTYDSSNWMQIHLYNVTGCDANNEYECVFETLTWKDPSPPNGATNSTQVIFSANCSSQGVTLWQGDQLKVNNLTGNQNFTTNVTVEGSYNITGSCDLGVTNNTRVWTYDTTDPTIVLNPSNGFTTANYSKFNQYENSIPINITVSDNIDLHGIIVTAYFNNGTILHNYTNLTISGTSYTYNAIIDTSTWARDLQVYFQINVSDSHTKNEIGDYIIKLKDKEIKFETEEGNEISIKTHENSIITAVKDSDRYRIKIDYLQEGKQNRRIDVKCNNELYYKENSVYEGHFVCANKLKGNWLDFEGTDALYTVEYIEDNHFTLYYTDLEQHVEFKSIGGLNFNSATYSAYIGQNTTSAPNTISGEAITINIDLTKDSHTANATLNSFIYNGTDYGVNVTITETAANINFEIAVNPYNVSSDTVFYFDWNISISLLDGYTYNLVNSGSNTIQTFSLDNCTISADKTAIFQIFDEQDPTSYLNGTMEIDGTYWVYENGESKNINLEYKENNTFSLCIAPQNQTVYSNIYIKYTSKNGFTHRWFLRNHSFTNTTQTINMGNYNTTTDISELSIIVRTISDYKYFPDVIGKLQRRYLDEGLWRTVQMDKSGDYGLLFYNIEEEDTDYRFIFMDLDENILKTTAGLKFVCIAGVCEITQLLNPAGAVAGTLDPRISYDFDNSTKLLSISWDVATGEAVTIQSLVTKETPRGSTSICDDTSTAAAGTIVCNTSLYSGTFLLQVLNDGSSDTTEYINSPAGGKIYNYLTKAEQTFWTALILIAVITAGVFSPVGVVIATIIGLIAVYFFGLFEPLTLAFLIVSAIMGLIISVKLKT